MRIESWEFVQPQCRSRIFSFQINPIKCISLYLEKKKFLLGKLGKGWGTRTMITIAATKHSQTIICPGNASIELLNITLIIIIIISISIIPQFFKSLHLILTIFVMLAGTIIPTLQMRKKEKKKEKVRLWNLKLIKCRRQNLNPRLFG